MLNGSPHFQKQAAQLRLLNELSTKLQSLLESENFYQEIVSLIQSRFNYYRVHIWNVEPDFSVTLCAHAGHALPNTLHASVGQAIRNQQNYLCNAISPTPASSPDTRAELCIPIIKDDKTIAALCIESDQPNVFDEDDVATWEAVGSQIAVAMTNRKLYFEATEFNKKLQQAVEEKTLELRRAHERILEQQLLLQKENKALKNLVEQDQKVMDIIGKSGPILSVISMVDKIAPTTATVLIQGESGTGKELIARRLHFRSDRSKKPYVIVNCGALQESLLESELFGHEKGSFTGAVAQKTGLCEIADCGTLFLDEIGEMSLGIQAKLLRFLQEGEFYRIGGNRPIQVDVRVVSATNRDLAQEVKAGRFREDLFYRLNTITVRVPALRSRREDIPELIHYFLKNSRFGGSGQKSYQVTPLVMEIFCNYNWPGNIRELQNTIERLKILGETNEIRVEDIPFAIRAPKIREARDAQEVAEDDEFVFNQPLEELEKNHILRTLAYNHGNKTKTAHSLGITIKTLYNKLHRYGVLHQQALSDNLV